MRITHYLYNAFLVEEGGTKIAIDPGQYFRLFDFRSLIPEEEWPTVTHIVITHGDPDHHWQSERIAVADDRQFKRSVEALGKKCCILGAGDVVTV